jgi:hypothetical protein
VLRPRSRAAIQLRPAERLRPTTPYQPPYRGESWQSGDPRSGRQGFERISLLISVQHQIIGIFYDGRCTLLYNAACCPVLNIPAGLLGARGTMSGWSCHWNGKPKKLETWKCRCPQSVFLRKVLFWHATSYGRKRESRNQKNGVSTESYNAVRNPRKIKTRHNSLSSARYSSKSSIPSRNRLAPFLPRQTETIRPSHAVWQ